MTSRNPSPLASCITSLCNWLATIVILFMPRLRDSIDVVSRREVMVSQHEGDSQRRGTENLHPEARSFYSFNRVLKLPSNPCRGPAPLLTYSQSQLYLEPSLHSLEAWSSLLTLWEWLTHNSAGKTEAWDWTSTTSCPHTYRLRGVRHRPHPLSSSPQAEVPPSRMSFISPYLLGSNPFPPVPGSHLSFYYQSSILLCLHCGFLGSGVNFPPHWLWTWPGDFAVANETWVGGWCDSSWWGVKEHRMTWCSCAAAICKEKPCSRWLLYSQPQSWDKSGSGLKAIRSIERRKYLFRKAWRVGLFAAYHHCYKTNTPSFSPQTVNT